jgi:hypothetical protein
MKFNIGDKVYRATFDRVETSIVCPDCAGTKRIRVLLADDTCLSIECGGCDPGGCRPSTGRIKQFEWKATTTPHTVTGIAMNAAETSYQLDNYGGSYYATDEKDTFATEAEALAAAELLKGKHQDEENARYRAKTKDEKSWAWNATYHRKAVKQAERDLEYHRGKVQVCDSHKQRKTTEG